MVPLIRQCAASVGVAATAVTEVITVFGTGSAALGNEAALQATAGAFALAILRMAAGCLSLFVLSSSNVLMPGCRPNTVPVIVPGSLRLNTEVTSWPFSRTLARSIAALVLALTAIAMPSPFGTKIGLGALRLLMA